MSFPIIINSNNKVSNNTFKVQLASSIDLNDYAVSVGSAYVYYSWYNINSTPLNNNVFNLIIPDTPTSVGYVITIPDGAYNISDLNNYLQYWLISQGMYITNNTTGINTYYCSFSISPTTYSVQFTTTPLPTSLPSGYTAGSGIYFPASANQHYQLIVLSDNNFKDIIGFNAGTYPASATNVGVQTKNSDYVPNVNPISAVQMRLSCVYNQFSTNSQLIHVFTNGDSAVGQIINASPIELQYVPCTGAHKEITLSFYDQLGNVLNMLDSNITIKLIFKKIN
tara:strand:- start:217 stop:1059 length:843 start_codon:yes stop_codon:yes gene_type:complete